MIKVGKSWRTYPYFRFRVQKSNYDKRFVRGTLDMSLAVGVSSMHAKQMLFVVVVSRNNGKVQHRNTSQRGRNALWHRTEGRKQNEAMKIRAALENTQTSSSVAVPKFRVGVGGTPCTHWVKGGPGEVGGGRATGGLGRS